MDAMPRLKTAAAAPPPPLAGLPASGSSSELQVRQGKLYLVRVGQPAIIRRSRLCGSSHTSLSPEPPNERRCDSAVESLPPFLHITSAPEDLEPHT